MPLFQKPYRPTKSVSGFALEIIIFTHVTPLPPLFNVYMQIKQWGKGGEIR
jgi:hypothetical protein